MIGARTGIGVAINRAVVGGFNSNYQAVLDYMSGQGYALPSAAKQALQNTMVQSLVDAGIWAKLDSFLLYATDGDSNASLVDFVNLTTRSVIGSPSFTANQGWSSTGVNEAINLGFTSDGTGNYTLNSGSFGYWLYSAATNSNFNMGAGSNAVMRGANGDTLNRINSGNVSASVDFNTVGMNHFNRTDATNVQAIINGTSNARTAAATALPTLNWAGLALNTTPASPSDCALSMQFIGGDLSSEASDFHTIMNTYMSAL